MRALTFQGAKQVRLDDVPRPAVKEPTDVLVRVTLSSICGSDLHIYHLQTPVNEGAVLGHEFVGVVEEVGSGVQRFRPGDRVVSAFFTSCGHCRLCRRGWFSQCETKGTFGHGEFFGGLGGAQAEYCVVPHADHTLELIPDELVDEDAIFVGDILATGLFGVERAEVRVGDSVAIIGAGPVGLMAIMCANLFGPARIFAVDMVESRLEMAGALGAIPINARETHPVEAIERVTGGHGADASIECVGLRASVDTAINCVRGGGTISMVGVPEAAESDFPYAQMWLKSLTFRSGWCNVQAHMRPLLDAVAHGRLHPAAIISHRMKLEQAVEAYDLFDNRQATKIVMTP